MTIPNFPPAPHYDHLTFLQVVPCFFKDGRQKPIKHEVFPIYLYKDAAGELIIVAEDKFEAPVDVLIKQGYFSKGGRR